ncbi:Clr5 domain-containing protein [Truncatella angustata]|uniref:Clr5 domain-containing protein n=1 Tax=Truncatella angustata TaxID=152316 RepID=A0A9P8ULL4_9PEZI|nr:Clr5 domain-containing protein [Truncatella angustata]KAH6654449.1 Clr5 domain-containing protein [Truncatella angustata]
MNKKQWVGGTESTIVLSTRSASAQYVSHAKGLNTQSKWPQPPVPPNVALHYPTDSDWDWSKSIIEDLYLRRNLPFRVVDHIMRQTYGFKASKRMYQTRFVKWGWKKSTQARAVQSTRMGRLHAQQLVLQTPDAPALPPARGTSLLLHESQSASHINAAVCGYRDYVLAWAGSDPRWQSATKFQDIDVTLPAFSLEDNMMMAAAYMSNQNVVEGGRFLRLAFLEVEKMIADAHLHTSWILFLWAPLKIYDMPQPMADATIKAYSRYLYQLSLIRRRHHPISSIARSLFDAAHSGGMSAVLAWASTMTHLLYDVYVQLRGLCAGAIAKLSLYAHRVQDRSMQQRVMGDTMDMSNDAAEEFGEDSIDALLPMCVALTHRAKLGMYDDIFLTNAVRAAQFSSKRYQRTIRCSSDSWYDRHNEHWTYRSSHFYLAKYWILQGDTEKFMEYARAATVIDDRPDDVWKMFANAVEKLFRERGLIEEADVLASKRKAYDMAPEAKEILAKEEDINVLAQDDSLREACEDSDDSE